jgi:hypothetical protein
MIKELEMIPMEEVLAKFKLLSQHYSGGTE